ncbi:ribonuclease HII [Patescibacteria group bacterium]|nr:ribonuclease HII [Patescibacteria group bacterium]
MKPTLRYEKTLWKQGLAHVAGIDEVGRGALAGPVFVSAVIFPSKLPKIRELSDIRDSKLISAKKRERLVPIIKSTALDWAYGKATVSEINHTGIVKATLMAMRRAVKALKQVDFVLVDAFHIPYLSGISRKKQLAVKKGDERCFTIAAASILAKVHRDKLMVKLGKRYPPYRLERHKGYGTLLHRQAIMKFGPQHFHRKTFIRKFLSYDTIHES